MLKNINGLDIRCLPNIGRDFGPMLCAFSKELLRYDIFGHFHSKKTPHAKNGSGWRKHLLNALLGQPMRVRQIFGLFKQLPNVGLVYPEAFWDLPYHWNTVDNDKKHLMALCLRLGIHLPKEDFIEFSAGSMFWARTDSLRTLLEAEWAWDMFGEETGATGGTLAHAVERVIVLAAAERGYRPAILADANA
jgi:lipopolysaccharide biosynthesis protein